MTHLAPKRTLMTEDLRPTTGTVQGWPSRPLFKPLQLSSPSLADSIRRLNAEGVGQSFERQEAFDARAIATSAAAMGASGGGVIAVGIRRSDGAVTGFAHSKTAAEARALMRERYSDISRRLEPHFFGTAMVETAVCELDGRSIAVVQVPPVRGGCGVAEGIGVAHYVREGASNRRITPSEAGAAAHIAASIYGYDVQSYDRQRVDAAAVPHPQLLTLDCSKVAAHCRVIRGREATEVDLELFENHLGSRDPETNTLMPLVGAVLCFGTDVATNLLVAPVTIRRVRGSSFLVPIYSADLLENVHIGGDLLEQAERVLKHLEERVDPRFLPLVQELALNAIVHRDYANRGAAISIIICDDRVVIRNPGTLSALPLSDTASRVRYPRGSLPVNQIVYSRFVERGLICPLGQGLRFLDAYRTKHGLPRFDLSSRGDVQATVYFTGSADSAAALSGSEFPGAAKVATAPVQTSPVTASPESAV